jgi:diguanylate cyclase (GGDEF)-like protein
MSERLIELGLLDRADDESNENQNENPPAELATFSARLLAVMSDTAIESDSLRTYEFRAKLEKYRHRLANSSDGDPDTAIIAADCLRLCEDYFTRARTYLLERETEFAEVIEVMRIALGKLTGDAKAFSGRLLGSSERFHRLTDIEDIRELKKQVAKEVGELNRIVVEKQKQDEVNFAKLSKHIEVLQTSLDVTKRQASLDPLTRIPNRGSFDQAIEYWVVAHRENRKPFVLALLDLDNFKQVNDTHGHQVGDRVLFCAAQWFGNSIRSSDFLARYGGEEFVMMLADVELSRAEAKFTELLAEIAACNYEYKKDSRDCVLRFTVSCGLAEFSPDDTAEELIRRADEALYEAKRTGRNRVVLGKKQKSFWKTLKPFVPFRDA